MYRDLSHPIESGMQTFPGDPPVNVSQAATVPEDGVEVKELCCGSHTGTHIDAPCHTEPDGDALEDRPVGEYVFDARFVDVAPCEPRERIDSEAIVDALAVEDPPEVLVIRTGYDAHWNSDAYRDHPYLAPEVASRLRAAGCGVAIDTLNPDPTPSPSSTEPSPADDEPDGVPVHRELLGRDLPILENLTALEGLPDRFTLYAFPLPLRAGDGAPVRAVAALEERS
ncbi:cyclase family protein [Halobiforma nitratireducens]|uniref:Cyclase family protein n=1 Tax=Halobiforma nitratireducens JCM 10879 TaxID=1227454 RepID=M0ML29_9EURY|nr:cyclase family protein [Halobiforma nitratireducens]EMA45140.1 cyclase family protein [Halobiforma nitratireducens JCM 10879]